MEALVHSYLIETIGWCAAAISIYSFHARTMIPLRILAIIGCCFSLAFASLRDTTPTIFANAVLLPLNVVRLVQMHRLIADARNAVSAPTDFGWLRPFMQEVKFAAGTTLFRRGDIGAEAWLIGSGEVWVAEHDAVVGEGAFLGEIGLLTHENRRTASAVARTDVRAWRIAYSDLEQLCVQNPAFCLHMARIIVQRYEANLVATGQSSKAAKPA